MMPQQYRQGDLLFVRVDVPPTEGLVARYSQVILLGEVTGHAHRLTTGTIMESADGLLYLELSYPAKVVHEEHDPIALDAGWWQVVRQREYTPRAPRLVED